MFRPLDGFPAQRLVPRRRIGTPWQGGAVDDPGPVWGGVQIEGMAKTSFLLDTPPPPAPNAWIRVSARSTGSRGTAKLAVMEEEKSY